MPNGATCDHHTALAVKVGQLETRLDEGDARMCKIEEAAKSMDQTMRGIQRTLWQWGALFSGLVFLLSIFGAKIAQAIFW